MGIGQPWTAGLPGLLSEEGCFGGIVAQGVGACKSLCPALKGMLKGPTNTTSAEDAPDARGMVKGAAP